MGLKMPLGQIVTDGTDRTRSEIIYQNKIDHNDFCYQCSKDGPDFLFGDLRIRDKKMNYFSLQKNKFLANTKLKQCLGKTLEEKKGS